MRPTTVLVGREREKYALSIVLSKSRMRNAIILGEAGVGKTELVRAIADEFKEYRFYEISTASLVAGTAYRGEFEEKMSKLIKAAKDEQTATGERIVLFFDEIHTVIGAGSSTSSRGDQAPLDAANILKPYLSDGSLIIWGATTVDEYKRFIQPEGAFDRRFSKIVLPELDEATTERILENFVKMNADGKIDAKAISSLVVERCRNDSEGHRPDREIELLDCALAIMARSGKGIQESVEDAYNIFRIFNDVRDHSDS
jgi:ATP-dependent Clp protease ATP-binding subunit ClpA